MDDVTISIEPLSGSPGTIAALAALLCETVAHGGSVSFMDPLDPDAAQAFWRVLLGARDGGRIVATVTLLLDQPPNQPHRAEIAKLMTAVSHRGRGLGTALMGAAEAEAARRGRGLLVLDTAADGGAAALYGALGYTRAGEIPDYALKPQGGLTATVIFWKRLQPA